MKRTLCLIALPVCSLFLLDPALAQNSTSQDSTAPGQYKANVSSEELVSRARDAYDARTYEDALNFAQQCIDTYKDEAMRQQAGLQSMPRDSERIKSVSVLNDVALAYFLQGEAYRKIDKKDEAVKAFKTVVQKFKYAQAWDMRGWYWSIAEKAQEAIDQIEPPAAAPRVYANVAPTKIVLNDPGKEAVVDYAKYGEFTGVGTENFKYVIKDQEGLSVAVGEGIYPNTSSVRWDPEFKKAMKEKRLEGTPWEFVHSPDLEAAFLKWATSSEPTGVRLYYTGMMLEKSGLIPQAIKAYYAVLVHYPGAAGWTYFKTPWYVAQASIGKIKYLLRKNPQMGLRLEGANVRIINGFDNIISNDKVICNPGKFVKVNNFLEQFRQKPATDSLTIRRRLGNGRVHLVQYETGDWQLIVDGKPYVIHGVTYAATRVGQSPDDGTLTSWMEDDFNHNGKADGPYDAFVDRNRNNKQDRDEPSVGDFTLMKEMGVNTIRVYHHPKPVKKEVLRDMYRNYGIRVVMGDFLGKYALGSGAKWNPGTDYTDEEQKKNMMDSVLNMVREFKDEPFVLFWLLGNENVYGYACNADKEPEAFYRFASEVAAKIKEIDPDHPVALCNGDVLYLDKFGRFATNIDIFGANAYRGEFGFGSFWQQVKEEADKPAFITEYGCSAYVQNADEKKARDEGDQVQAEYLAGSWEDIEDNMAFGGGAGNSLGGIAFEWLDEWWKAYEPAQHDWKGNWVGPFPDGTMHEEWLGLFGQGDGKMSPFLREPRRVYDMYKRAWKR